VLVAAVIAGPLAYFVMDRWLQNFAYRTSLDVTTFILSGLAAIAIAILTIGFQVIKAANTDPVKVLRYE
jgi:putative ABC transport system permease protein